VLSTLTIGVGKFWSRAKSRRVTAEPG
jgi:hypothetical protein